MTATRQSIIYNNLGKVFSPLIFLFFFPFWGYGQQFTEIAHNIQTIGFTNSQWGDYDNDGDLDILLMGNYGANNPLECQIFNNNQGVFTKINPNISGVISGNSEWLDFDNDGDLDVLLTGHDDKQRPITKLYINEGGNFIHKPIGLHSYNLCKVAWGDMDKDGDLDLAISGVSTFDYKYKSLVLRNDAGEFNTSHISLDAILWNTMEWGDYDIDGDLDLLATGYSNYYTVGLKPMAKIYKNTGGFFTEQDAGLVAVKNSFSSWGDYDNDGDLDIVIAGDEEKAIGLSSTRIYRQDIGIFTDIKAGLPFLESGTSSWADYDNDGDLDLLLSGQSYEKHWLNLYRNDDGYFIDIEFGFHGTFGANPAWGDYDNDGDLDILITTVRQGDTPPAIKIYRNNNARKNIKPQAPTSLVLKVVGRDVVLSWDKANDKETLQSALSYNIRIGRKSGGSDFCSPMSGANGYRQVVGNGNAGTKNNGITYKNLRDGLYFWSVQAVDQAYAGSAFSGESMFYIGAVPVPRILTATGIECQKFTARWDSVPGVTVYQLDVSTRDDFKYLLPGYEGKAVEGLSWDLTGLNANTTYYYRVRAAKAFVSGNSNKMSVKTFPCAPTALPATQVLGKNFTANWEPMPGVTAFQLDVSEDAGFVNFVPGYQSKEVSGVSASVSGLMSKTTYYYRLRAVAGGLVSQNSNTKGTTTIFVPETAGIKLYPSPFRELLFLEIGLPSGAGGTSAQILFYDMLGRKAGEANIAGLPEGLTKTDVSGAVHDREAGIYLAVVQITDTNGNLVLRETVKLEKLR